MTGEQCIQILKSHYKKAGKLHLRPWDRTSYTEFTDLHVRLSLHKVDRGKRGGEEIRKVPLPGSTKDIFSTKVDGSLPNRILMLGAAGYGKTTTIAKIAYDWACENRDSPLQNVPFLFALKFRQTDKDTSLGDAIVTQLLGHANNITAEEIEKFIGENQDACTILLDGFDEFNGSIVGKCQQKTSLIELLLSQRFRNCRVLVTTRPHRVEEFDTYDVPNMYAKIEIEGFESEDAHEYVDRFFASSDNPSQAGELREHLNTQHAIGSLVTVPFFCMTFCTLWQEGLLKSAQTLSLLFNNLLRYLVQHAQTRRGRSSPRGENKFTLLSEQDVKCKITVLGEVAWQGLMCDNKKLIFSSEDFSTCSEELELAEDLGLVSSQKWASDSYKTTKTVVEFYHKMAQEHCAGLYLASLSRRELEQNLRALDTEDKLEDFKNVLLFASGSSGDAALAIMSHLQTVKWEDKGMCQCAMLGVLAELPTNVDYKKRNSFLDVLRPYFEAGHLTVNRSSVHGVYSLPDEIVLAIRSADISHSHLSSQQTKHLWTFLSNCPSLKQLNIVRCRLPHKDALPRLNSVEIIRIQETGDPGLVASVPEVQEVQVSPYSIELDQNVDSMMKGVSSDIKQTEGNQCALKVRLFGRSPLSETVVKDFIEVTLPHMQFLQILDLEVWLHKEYAARIIARCLEKSCFYKVRVRCGREESSALDFIFECGEVSKKEMDPSQWKDFDNTHADAASCKRLYVGLFDRTHCFGNPTGGAVYIIGQMQGGDCENRSVSVKRTSRAYTIYVK